MSFNHSFPLFGNNPRFSELTVILFALLTLTGCSHTYTLDQRARITELATEFKTVCDLGNECERAQNVSCDFTDYSSHEKVIDHTDAQAERDCE